jgi:hypothetical protein
VETSSSKASPVETSTSKATPVETSSSTAATACRGGLTHCCT